MPTRAEFRLISYSAIANGAKGLFYFSWRSRPVWERMSGGGIVDPFENPTEIWDELGKLGKLVSSVGPLLMNTVVDEDAPAGIIVPSIPSTWENTVPGIDFGMLKDNSRDMYFMVVYSNDPKNKQKGLVNLGAEFMKGKKVYDLNNNFKEIELMNQGDREVFTADYIEGEGHIYLLADKKNYKYVKGSIGAKEFKDQKDMTRYDLYLLKLSGIAGDKEVEKFKAIDSINKLKAFDTELKALEEGAAEFLEVKSTLKVIQKKMGAVNKIFEDKITSLESEMPKGIASEYPVREFMGSDPLVKPYIGTAVDIASIYFAYQNFFYQGKYKEIKIDLPAIKYLADALHKQMNKNFVENKKAAAIDISQEDIDKLKERKKMLEEIYNGSYPKPDF
ncbi:MAG: hypothetical protein ACYTFY_22445 [Planctomycetota bacterium]|jgi:hypothetical protein